VNDKTGDFEIYSNKLDSVNIDGENWVTKITVTLNGLPNVPAVSGFLSYKLLHPCLANKGIV